MRLIGSFGVYRTPLNSLWSARACFGDCIALLLSLFGNLCGLFGAPWAVLRHTLGHLGLHWDVLGASRDSIGDFASTGDSFASRGPSSTIFSTAPAHKTKPDGICIQMCPDEPMWQRNGPRTANQDLPSTRAGDQDDMSFTSSLKLSLLRVHTSKLHPTLPAPDWRN